MKKKLLSLLCLLLALTLLAACGAKSAAPMGADQSAPADMPAEAPAEPAPDFNASADSAEMDYFEPTEEAPADMENGGFAGDGQEVTAQKAVDLTEKLIYRASLYIESTEFDRSVAGLETLVTELQGFIEGSEVYGNTVYQPDGSTQVVNRHAYYTIRVPASSFRQALTRAGDLGNVTNTSTSVENITSQFTDQEARKHSLEVQEERLLDMLEKAQDVDTLVILESRLSDIRYEIEAIERQLRNWQTQVDYSTITVDISEVEIYTPTATVQRSFSEKLSTAFRDGWSGFVRGLQRGTLLLAESLPSLVLLAVIVIAIVLLVRFFRRRKKAKKLPPKQPESPSDDKPES